MHARYMKIAMRSLATKKSQRARNLLTAWIREDSQNPGTDAPLLISPLTLRVPQKSPGRFSFRIDRDMLISLGRLAETCSENSLAILFEFDPSSHTIRHFTISE